tara:strand:- start:3517 stop:3939 length:423 start_codon:yes stop_codon:yes gene_type:complete
MLIKLLCFFTGMVSAWIFSYVLGVGYSINVLNRAQRSCAALFMTCEDGVQQILHLKYIAMEESAKSEQSITAQKFIDQINLDGVKKTVMKNYVNSFPVTYHHIMEFETWDELQDYINEIAKQERRDRVNSRKKTQEDQRG